VDGIVLHQIVQWHNMLSSTERWPTTTLKGMEANMRADGLFHAATWVLVVLGLWMLWKAMRTGAYGSGRVLVGWMLAGWGIFNLCEGIISHEILGLHHVKEGETNSPGISRFWRSGRRLDASRSFTTSSAAPTI
jgi:uncharacterized membrane protein